MPRGQTDLAVTLNVKNIHFNPQSHSLSLVVFPPSPFLCDMYYSWWCPKLKPFHMKEYIKKGTVEKRIDQTILLSIPRFAIVTCDYANLDYTICFPKRYPFHFPQISH